MFRILHDKLWGVKEADRHEMPEGDVHYTQIREIAAAMKVNDYVICKDQKQAQRIYVRLKKINRSSQTRTVREKGKIVVKLWRLT